MRPVMRPVRRVRSTAVRESSADLTPRSGKRRKNRCGEPRRPFSPFRVSTKPLLQAGPAHSCSGRMRPPFPVSSRPMRESPMQRVRRRLLPSVLANFGGLLHCACAGKTPTPDDAVPAAASLEGTSWVLDELPAGRVLVGDAPTAQFEAGQVRGTDGCNRYSAPFTVSGSRLSVGQGGAATLMACPPEVMEQARAFRDALEGCDAGGDVGSVDVPVRRVGSPRSQQREAGRRRRPRRGAAGHDLRDERHGRRIGRLQSLHRDLHAGADAAPSAEFHLMPPQA